VAEAGVPHQARRLRQVPALYLLSGLVALVLLLPEVFLVAQASDAGWSQVSRVLFRPLSAELLRNTVELTALVAVATAVIGTATAWLVVRTAVPLRRLWGALVVLPIAIPDFIMGYAWHSLSPGFIGLPAAAVVMTLDLYPLVYLPVSAALRRTDPALEESARALGIGPWAIFRRVIFPQVRPALAGALLVVSLALLAEFGAFEIVDFQTFTTEIFAELNVDQSAAAALALVLVALGLLVLLAEAASAGRGRVSRSGPQAARPPARARLGWWNGPALLGLTLLVTASLGVPVGTLAYWLTQSRTTTLPASTTLLGAAAATARYSLAAAVLATAVAVPVALLAGQRRGRIARVIENSTFLIQSVPGVVIALSLVFFAVRYAFPLYQQSSLLVIAYGLLFFPLALVSLRASTAQVSPRLTEMARSLGCRPAAAFARVTLPLILPGVAAALCLVFLSSVTELTATLVLVPTGVQTLATQFWAYQTSTAYGAAAPYAVAILVLAAVPNLAVAAWFARRQATTRLVTVP
jgi:iron(III) transport system permease protein